MSTCILRANKCFIMIAFSHTIKDFSTKPHCVLRRLPTTTHPAMGKQSQIQTRSQIRAQTLTQPLRDAISTTATAYLADAPPQNPYPIAKIPFRSRKIRKISPKAAQVITSGNSKSIASKTANDSIVDHQPKPTPGIVPLSLSSEGEIETALRHLRNADPQLASVIDIHKPPTFDSSHAPFLALSRSILYQQLSAKAGASIYTRFLALCGGESSVLPDTVLALTPQQLREVGVSGRKASYLHDLSSNYQSGVLSDSSIVEMDDKSLFTKLTMVKGIGLWSVHMFLIFSLHRPDVLPVGDLGVRKGVQLLYGLKKLPQPSEMDQLCQKWSPYRSAASWYMWRLVEAKGAP